jgi:hypothetical protein
MSAPFGKIIGEPITAYHSSDAISASRLSVFHESPVLFFQRFIAKTRPGPESKAINLGKALHFRMEGKDAYAANVAVWPDGDFKNKAAQAWRDIQEGNGLIALNTDDGAKVEAMYENAHAKKSILSLLENTESEVTFRVQFGAFTVQCRPDRLGEKHFVDFKSLPELSMWQNQIFDYGYHRAAVFYEEVIHAATGNRLIPYFVPCEKQGCNDCFATILEPETLEIARVEVMQDLVNLRHCYETNAWPGVPDTIQSTGLAFYHKRQAQAALESKQALLQ